MEIEQQPQQQPQLSDQSHGLCTTIPEVKCLKRNTTNQETESVELLKMSTNRLIRVYVMVYYNKSVTVGDLQWGQEGKSPLPGTLMELGWREHQLTFLWYRMLAGAARQPLFSAILSSSIYLSTSVRRFSPLQSARQPPDVACLKIAYGEIAGLHNIFPSALCRCH